MEENELIAIDVKNFSQYVLNKKIAFGLSNKEFGEKVGLSEGEISKIINRKRLSVSLHSFYAISVKTGDTIEQTRDFVYPHRNFDLKIIKDQIDTNRTRKGFGIFMQDNYETDTKDNVQGKNAFEIILAKTGISKQRLTDIYFGTGAPEPYELLLIEKAVGKNTGEMMKEYITMYPNKKKGE